MSHSINSADECALLTLSAYLHLTVANQYVWKITGVNISLGINTFNITFKCNTVIAPQIMLSHPALLLLCCLKLSCFLFCLSNRHVYPSLTTSAY